MITSRGADILDDNYRIEIFQSSCKSLLSAITKRMRLNKEKIKFFARFYSLLSSGNRHKIF